MNKRALSPKQQVNINKWMNLFREKNQSKETIKDFCEGKGITRTSYY